MRSSRFASALVHKNAMSFAQHFSELKFSFTRSEEHTSELQSQSNLVCRLLLEKKKKTSNPLLITQKTTRNPKPQGISHIHLHSNTTRLYPHAHSFPISTYSVACSLLNCYRTR